MMGVATYHIGFRFSTTSEDIRVTFGERIDSGHTKNSAEG